jgi:hypothetical protein
MLAGHPVVMKVCVCVLTAVSYTTSSKLCSSRLVLYSSFNVVRYAVMVVFSKHRSMLGAFAIVRL